MSRYWLLAKAFAPLASLLIAACAPTEGDVSANNRVSVTSTGVLEGNVGQTTLSFTVESPIEQRIRYQTTNLTAAAGSDYISIAGQLTVQPGANQIINVPVIGDLQVEADEQVGLVITYEDGSTSHHEGTIINDDRPTVLVTNQPVNEGGAGEFSSLTFTITLSQKTLTPFPVRVLTRDESPSVISNRVGSSYQPAAANSDYEPIDRIVTFPANSIETTVSVVVYGDTQIEQNEAFSIHVYEPTDDPLTATALATSFGRIRNDDGPGFNMPEINLSTGRVSEGDIGSGNSMTFFVSLPKGPNEVDFSIYYEVVLPITATSPFTADSADLKASEKLAPPGILFRDIKTTDNLPISGVINIPIIGDDQYEADEVFHLILKTEDGIELARAAGTIENDDTPNFSLSAETAPEGNSGTSDMVFTLTLDERELFEETLELNYLTSTSSSDIAPATPDVDFINKKGELTFKNTETSKAITVQIKGDVDYEKNETFNLVVRNIDNVILADAKGTIENDDDPELTITPPSETRVDENSGDTIVFGAQFTREVTRVTTLYYEIYSSDTATIGLTGDTSTDVSVNALTGSAVFDSGSTTPRSTSIPPSVTINDDSIVEEDKSFTVSYYATEFDRNNRRFSIGDSTILIIDDDFVEVQFSTSTFLAEEGSNESYNSLQSLTSSQPHPVLEVSKGVLNVDTAVTLVVSDIGTFESDDYQLPLNATVIIPADDYTTTGIIEISEFLVSSDTRLENDETLTLKLTDIVTPGSRLAVGTRDTLQITLENDDSLELGFSSVVEQSASESASTVVIDLYAFNAVDADYNPAGPGGRPLELTIDLVGAGGLGQAEAADFTPNLPVTLSFTAFPIDVGTVSVAGMPSVRNDNLVEFDETARLELTPEADSLVTVNTATAQVDYVLVSDDKIIITLDTTAVNVTEGASPTIPITAVGAILDADSPSLTFEVTATAGTGTEPDDFTFSSGTVTIPVGSYLTTTDLSDQLSGHLTITDDAIVEDTETLTLSLSPIAASLTSVLEYADGSATKTLSILNDDTLTLSLDTTAANVAEGANASVPITISGAELNADSPALTFNIYVTADAGTENADFNLSTSSITVPGNTDYRGGVVLADLLDGILTLETDDLVEETETLTLGLLSIDAGLSGFITYSDSSATKTLSIISNDKLTVTLDPAPVDVTEGASPTIPITAVGAILDGDSPPLTFEVTAAADVGTESNDFAFTPGTVTIPVASYLTTTDLSALFSGRLTIADDAIVEDTETLTLSLSPIAASLTSVLEYADGNATKTLAILNDDQLTVSFTQARYEYFEDLSVPPAIKVDGTTEIDVVVEYERTGGEAYPAVEGEDVSLAASLTVDSTHVSGHVYDFPAIEISDTTTEFNEGMAVRLKTGAESAQPINLAAETESTLILLNDDLTLYVNGSGIDYCADSAGAIVTDCTSIAEALLASQDGKIAEPAFSSTNPSTADDSTPLTWQCLTDARTALTWAFEDSAPPELYFNDQVTTQLDDMTARAVCGKSDWRRPTFNELTNLMTFATESELLDVSKFTTVQFAAGTDRYWFQESDGTSDPGLLSFNLGQATLDADLRNGAGDQGYLMLVSGSAADLVETRPTTVYECANDLDLSAYEPPAPTSNHRYTVNGLEITDNMTGLTWAARSLLTSVSHDTNPTWGTALNQADGYNGDPTDGTGWRAPTIKELLSLVTLNCNAAGFTTDTNLPNFFLPRMNTGKTALLPLMSSSPVNNTSAEIWTLQLSTESALISRSAPPSSTVDMQTFVVKAP